MAAKKSKKPKAPASPSDTALLDVLQSVLSKRHFTGKVSIRLSPKNKGLLIEENPHSYPQFDSIREAIKDFGETHGMLSSDG